jgi:hypothetical protein
MTDSSAEKTLRRVLVIAGIDGWSIAAFAGLCTLISLLCGEWLGVGIGGLITTAGMIELRGRKRLMRGEADGMSGLVRAQLIILGTILLYSLENLLAYDEAAIMAQITPEIRGLVSQWLGVSISELQPLMRPVYMCVYITLSVVTVLFQGGLALYYRSCRAMVSDALVSQRPPVLPTR